MHHIDANRTQKTTMLPLQQVVTPSSYPFKDSRRFFPPLVALIGFLWLMTPRLYGNFAGHLHKEDGTIFLSEHLQGHGLLDLYTGYLHLYPRTITSI